MIVATKPEGGAQPFEDLNSSDVQNYIDTMCDGYKTMLASGFPGISYNGDAEGSLTIINQKVFVRIDGSGHDSKHNKDRIVSVLVTAHNSVLFIITVSCYSGDGDMEKQIGSILSTLSFQ